MSAYDEFWCPDYMRDFDPQGCGIGLALGYVWVPVLALILLGTLVYLAVGRRR